MSSSTVIHRVAQEVATSALQTADPRMVRRETLELLGKLVPFESAIFLSGPSLSGPPVAINKDRAGHFHSVYVARREHFVAELKPTRAASQAQGGVYRDTEVFSAADRGRLAFFQEVIRPQHITSQVVLHLRFRGQLVGAIHCCRHDKSTPFSEHDERTLAHLVPTVALAHVASSGLSPAEPLSPLRVELSKRERQIASHLCHGLRTREIAALLGTSPHTVRNQLQRLYEKTGTSTRTELALLISRGSAHPLPDE